MKLHVPNMHVSLLSQNKPAWTHMITYKVFVEKKC